jgi:hypothetical protein
LVSIPADGTGSIPPKSAASQASAAVVPCLAGVEFA